MLMDLLSEYSIKHAAGLKMSGSGISSDFGSGSGGFKITFGKGSTSGAIACVNVSIPGLQKKTYTVLLSPFSHNDAIQGSRSAMITLTFDNPGMYVYILTVLV